VNNATKRRRLAALREWLILLLQGVAILAVLWFLTVLVFCF